MQIDIPGYQEQLVVDGRIETGQPAIVLLSKSANVYSSTNFDSYLNSFVDDAIDNVACECLFAFDDCWEHV